MGKTYPRVTELLKKEFEEKGVTKYAFCKQTGINPTSVERYLCGISEPNQASLEKLADYFKVSVSWLRGATPWDIEDEERLTSDYLEYFTGEAATGRYDLRRAAQDLRAWTVGYRKLAGVDKDEVELLMSGVYQHFLLFAVFLSIIPESRASALEMLKLFNEKIDCVSALTSILPEHEITPPPAATE